MGQLFLSDFFGFLNLNGKKKIEIYYYYYYYYFGVKLFFPRKKIIMLEKKKEKKRKNLGKFLWWFISWYKQDSDY